MKKIKILYIINGLEHGGTERQLMQLLGHLDRTRFEPHLCSFSNPEGFIDTTQTGCHRFRYSNILYPRYWIEVWHLINYCRAHHIKIIHTFFQDPTVIGVFLKWGLGSKLVVSFRDLGFWRTRWLDMKMRFFYSFADSFLANAKAVKGHYVKTDHIPENRVSVIYNGVTAPDPANYKTADNKVVGIVANLNRSVKRVEDFVRAAAFVKKELPDVRYCIIGDGYLKKELIILAKELKMDANIHFLGRVTNPEVFISKFDIGVLTSETEGLSNSILEYMAHGIPVIATSVGGNSELIKNGENGYLVEVGDPQAMAEKIIYLFKNLSVMQQMGTVNHHLIRRKFAMEKMIAAHETFYENLINESKN